jgi:hypothetical protein
MPFTFAHPAAVLPLRRFKPLHLAALIVGSVTPDLPYYVPAKYARAMVATHTAGGAIFIDIPLGMLTLLVGFLLRRPLAVLMTPRARNLCLHSMERFKEQPTNWLWAPLGIYVGVWTHLLWDSFTHDSGWLTQRVSALSAPIYIGTYTGTLCHLLQYVSSVAGLIILAFWYVRLRTSEWEPPQQTAFLSSPVRTAVMLMICTTAAAVGGFIAVHVASQGAANYRIIYVMLTRSIAWFVVLYVAAGSLILLSRRKPEPLAEL